MSFRNRKALFAIAIVSAEWTDITSMQIGIFLPDECGDPNSGLSCGGGEQALYVSRLEFDAEAVPEPASLWLLVTGLSALGIRRARRT